MESLGRYQLMERIGGGGMADVYRAAALGPAGFRKIVAVKIIRPAMCEDAEFVQMFQREAAIAARICHPNAVQVFEFNRDRRQHYLVMEYVEGMDLKTLLERCGGPLPPALAFFIAAKVLFALSHAHTLCDESGRCLRIIHRDVTPHNILLSVNGDVKLADFGIAKAQDSANFTHANMVRGKLPYLSPEQARGEPLDPRTDLYSLGLVLFEMLTGVRRFCHRGSGGMAEVMAGRFLPPSHLEPKLDAIADFLTARLCAPRREERFASAQEALFAVEKHFSWDGSACLGQWVRNHMPEKNPAEACTQLLARDEPSCTFGFGDGDRPTTKLEMARTRLITAAALDMAEAPTEAALLPESTPDAVAPDLASVPKPAAPARRHFFARGILLILLGMAGFAVGGAAAPFLSKSARDPAFHAFPIPAPAQTAPVHADEKPAGVLSAQPQASVETLSASPVLQPDKTERPRPAVLRRTRVIAAVPPAASSAKIPNPQPAPELPAPISPAPRSTRVQAPSSIGDLKSAPDWE